MTNCRILERYGNNNYVLSATHDLSLPSWTYVELACQQHGVTTAVGATGLAPFVCTFATARKLKRIRRNPDVIIAPSTFRGTPTGPALRARARVLAGAESAHAGRLLARKHRLLQGLLVPLAHRLRGNTTVHLELTPIIDAPATRR